MKAKDIFAKTTKFIWLKLAMGAAITVASVILLALFMLFGTLIGGSAPIFMGLLWIGCTWGVYRFAMSYVGYLIKAGHVAVIAEICTTGNVPDNMFNYGKEKVKARFATSSVYFAVDRLVSGSVRQLQRASGKVGDLFSAIPGMSFVTSLVQTFIGVVLGYIDECCLGWCFVKEEENSFKASCDGVVIYFQNIKHLLKSSAKVTLLVVALTFLAWLVPFLLLVGLFKLLNWSIALAIVLAVIIAATLKSAFIDSWMMIEMMTSYMEVAPSTGISFDLYDKLCKLSRKFRQLFEKGREQAVPVPEVQQGI